VIAGAAVAALGVIYWMHARPAAGDTIASYGAPEAGEGASLIVRAERGGARAFLELHGTSPLSGDYVVWQALVPHYAGDAHRPGLAWSHDVVTIRVERGSRAEVFALSMRDGSKLGGFRLAVEHEPVRTQPTGPITLTDHTRAYEVVGGDGWHQLIAVDLATGQGLWKVELGPEAVVDGGASAGRVWVTQGARTKAFASASGSDEGVTATPKRL
jgi:hypothetical protein